MIEDEETKTEETKADAPKKPAAPPKGVIIQGTDFVLKSLDEGSNVYDLYFLKVTNKGKPNQKLEFKIYGYGMGIGKCLASIIQYRVRKRKGVFKGNGDDGLKQYMQLFLEEKQRLLAVFDFTQDEWNRLSRLKRVKLDETKQSAPVEADLADINDD